MITSPNSIMSDFGTSAKRTWKPKIHKDSTNTTEQLPSLFAASVNLPKPKKTITPSKTVVPPPVNKRQERVIIESPKATTPASTPPTSSEETVPSLFQSAVSKSPKKIASVKTEAQKLPKPDGSNTESRKAARAAASKNNKIKSATMPPARTPSAPKMSTVPKTPIQTSKQTVTMPGYSPAGSYAFDKLKALSPTKKSSSPKKSPSLPTSSTAPASQNPQRQYLGSPRPKSPQKNTKVVSVFYKPPSPSTPSNMNADKATAAGLPNNTTMPLSPEQQHALMASLPMFMYREEPSPLIDTNKHQSVLDKLRQAEYDNESVSSEAEALERQTQSGKGRQAESEFKEKLSHFFSDHSISSDGDDSDDNVSISSASSEESGLFRY